MRLNEPVTNDEYILPDGEVIITQTDPQSRITYANPAFVASSGFALPECLGEPQNLVRHPDMPREAFADLWRTIRHGKPWTGIVKNRRKSGGFYWVRANVTPIMEAGQIRGYMSVRVKPTRAEITEAAAAYAAIRAGNAKHLRIVEGRVRDISLKGRIAALADLPLGTGTSIVVGSIAGLFAAIGVALLLSDGRPDGSLRAIILGACALGSIVALLNLFYVRGRVVRPMIEMIEAANGLVAGDVRASFSTVGDPQIASLARTLRQLAAKVTGVLKDTSLAVGGMNGAVNGIVEANGELSNRTNETAASLEQTAASVEELTATVTRNTENAREANKLAAKASQVTTDGGRVVGEVAATMSGISSSSKKIGDIVGIIDGIAFQTNLLALNASVEAARAGEQGRGFAVVAQEVRSLAQRSGAAAKEIRELITESVATVERGTELAARAEQTMRDVVGSVKHVANIINEIEMASREQNAGIEQINQAVMQMDQITQRNAAMAQDVAQTAQNLQQQSATVTQSVSSFSLQQASGPAGRAAPAASAAGSPRAPPAEDRVAAAA